MTPIDQQLYEMFPSKESIQVQKDMWINMAPQLHDVFRVAKERNKYMEVRTMIYDRIELSIKENPHPLCIPYNPTLPLLLQSDDTKSAIISLFK